MVASRGRCRVAVWTAARGRQRTPGRVRGGLGKCLATATCVHDPARDEPPGGRQGRSSASGCGPTSGLVHSTPAARTRDRQKKICCVTTRRRNLRVVCCLRRSSGTLTAPTLRRGVLGFDGIVLAPPGLPLRRLPAADLAQALGILAVTLVPTPRLVLVPAAFAQTEPRPRSSRTGTAAALWINMTAAHGSVDLPRDSPGRTRYRSPRALIKTGKQTVSLYLRA